MLDRIVERKRTEVAAVRARGPELRAAALAAAAAPSFGDALVRGESVAVIAELKRRSPSAGAIRAGASAAAVAAAYEAAGVAAVSVLTDRDFGGELGDLAEVRAAVSLPLLRKDFTIDPVQVYEAKAAGASAVLLIARILEDGALAELGALVRELGLDALVEVHDETELERAVRAGAKLIGINNRDLTTFRTDLATTQRLAPLAPRGCVLVGESGVRDAGDVAVLAAAGVAAVLVGESLMRAPDPFRAARSLAGVPRQAR